MSRKVTHNSDFILSATLKYYMYYVNYSNFGAAVTSRLVFRIPGAASYLVPLLVTHKATPSSALTPTPS